MEIETTKIEFDNGEWWEILDEMPFGVSRKLAKVVSKYGGEATIEAAFESNIAMMLSCTTSWSFGDVTEDVLEGIPNHIAQRMLVKMNEQYQERWDGENQDIKKD